MIKALKSAISYVIDWLNQHMPPPQTPGSLKPSDKQATPEKGFDWYGEIRR